MKTYKAGLVTTEGLTSVITVRAKTLEAATKSAGRYLIGYYAGRKIEPGKIWCKNGLRVAVLVEPIE